ncbi:hypothetical protein Golob_014082 [Gossypium lobatum]|uniref:Uncharacterized protein n=1 Tax=Gossypium lobatum TaxID=34289 RepID=A0A7J8LRD3_9ROSI|nr:hypothetical protein [Gossypium lobatum]
MDKKGIICLVVILLGTVSAITGFAAEATRVKVKKKINFENFKTYRMNCTDTRFSELDWLRITSILALTLLLKAAAFQAQHKEATVMNGWEYCPLVRPGIFACGAVLAVISLVFGILCYLTLNSKGKEDAKAPVPNQGDITMAQPQFPLENPDSVNEDAKNKQQFS